MVPTAATFCNFIPGIGMKILNEYLLKQNYLTRASSSFGSSRFSCNAEFFLQKAYMRQLELKKQRQCQWAFSGDKVVSYDPTHKEGREENISKATLIWRAIKLPIYSVALVPLTVGSAAAYLQTGIFSARQYFVLLASSVSIITWLNLSNDVYDLDTGADKNKKESVVNLVGRNPGCCLRVTRSWLPGVDMGICKDRKYSCYTVTSLCNYLWICIPVSTISLELPRIGRAIVLCSIWPICYYCFLLIAGESKVVKKKTLFNSSAIYFGFQFCIFCSFLFSVSHVLDNDFGGFDSETSLLPLTGTILSASFLVGFTTSLILFCSHFHQVEGDKAVGKISPLVRLGTEGGSRVVKVAVITLYSLLCALGLSKALPLTCIFLCAFTFPMGKLVVDFVEENHKDKQKIFVAKYYCVRLHALFGAALAAGMLTKRYLPSLIFS